MPLAKSNGCEIWWQSEGSGDQTILLIMGFGNASGLWQPVVDRLADRYRVIRFDNRGTGRSEAPREPYTTEQMAADVVAVLDAAGVAQASLFGVSMGSVIAQEVAIEHPDRVSSLILGCATCPKHLIEPSKAGLALLLLKPLLPTGVANRWLARYTMHPPVPPELTRQVQELREKTPRGTAWRQARGGGRETCSRLGSVRAPTLVLHGAKDRLVPPANGRSIAERIPGATFVEIPAAGHLFFLEALDRCVDEVDRHLSALAPLPALRQPGSQEASS